MKITPKLRKGFTLVEISLFLGITMFLVVALIASSGSSISRQRYNDTTQDFIEFLRTAYAEATNIQNSRSFNLGVNDFCSLSDAAEHGRFIAQDTTGLPSDQGRTSCAIYGKLLTFGEKPNDPTIYSYDIIGQATSSTKLSGMSTLDALAAVRRHCHCTHWQPQTIATVTLLLLAFKTPIFHNGAPVLSRLSKANSLGRRYDIRSPASGTVYTYATNNSIFCQDQFSHPPAQSVVPPYLLPKITPKSSRHSRWFSRTRLHPKLRQLAATDVHLCLASEDASSVGNRRREIRIKTNGRSVNAIELIPMDSEENQCL